MTGPEVATDCDRCHAPIAFGETCYAVATGKTWPAGDGDHEDQVAEIVCSDCYGDGPATGQQPRAAVIESQP